MRTLAPHHLYVDILKPTELTANQNIKKSTMSKLDESMENFLTEIEEYSKRLEEEKNLEKSNETNSDLEFEEVSDNLVDNLYKSRDKIMSLKEDLETDRLKVKTLEDLVEKQQQHIKILTKEKSKEKEGIQPITGKRCRYWNRGFCREKEGCMFIHVNEDCEKFQEEGSCYDKACRKRHRKKC